MAADAPLVAGAEQAVVRAACVRDERELLLEIEINPGRANRARVNRGAAAPAARAARLVRTVLFAPEDLALVKGDPAERRRFLDELLVSRTPRLAGVRADYDRVLKQRNALLKTARLARRQRAAATLGVWDEHLATRRRSCCRAAGLIAELAPHVAEPTRTWPAAAGASPARLPQPCRGR